MKNSLKKCSFLPFLLSRGCGCCLRRKRKTRFLGLQKKGLIQCGLAGKREHATGQRLAAGLWACCWPCGLAAGLWACCWPCGLAAGLVGLLAGWPCRLCLLLLLFFFFSNFNTSLHLKNNIKFRLYKIKMMHVNKFFLYNVMK